MEEILKVVLVDDDIDLLETYEDGLDGMGGFEVHTAHDSVSAMRVINQIHPEIVVVDLNLPHTPIGTIIPFVRGLRRKKAMEIIIVSGDDNIETIAKLWNVQHYLKKPVSPIQLAEKLIAIDPRVNS